VTKPGNYWLKTVNKNNCISADTIDFIAYSPPVFDIRDTVFCRNTIVVLDALNLNSSTQAESKYLWNNGALSSRIVVGLPGTYSVVVNNQYCSHRDTAKLSYIQTGLDLGPDTFYCGPVNRTVYAQSNFVSYLWQDGSTYSSDRALSPGKYKVIIVSKDGCIEADSMMIYQYPVLDPGLGDDTTVCISSEIYLSAADSMVSYLWNNGARTQKISAMEKGLFTVTVSNKQGCIASDSVMVSTDPNAVPNELFMPDAFTPNNDGINDVFPSNRYNNLNSFYRLKIFNRWGEEIFETEVTGVQWDGTYKGTEAPQDVYVFMVSSVGCDGQERHFRGTFNLLR
jgi:gliding motility-associated-like protein